MNRKNSLPYRALKTDENEIVMRGKEPTSLTHVTMSRAGMTCHPAVVAPSYRFGVVTPSCLALACDVVASARTRAAVWIRRRKKKE